MKATELTVKLWVLPRCEPCAEIGINKDAEYDAKIYLYREPTWAYVCSLCFKTGSGKLGLGRGQKIEVHSEN